MTKKYSTIESLQQFKELYFPKMISVDKLRSDKGEEDYGNVIAMSILEGIKRDLTTLHK